jgi:hypothetical protein
MGHLLYVSRAPSCNSVVSDLVVDSIIQENDDWASSAKADAGGNCVLYTYVSVPPQSPVEFSLMHLIETINARDPLSPLLQRASRMYSKEALIL